MNTENYQKIPAGVDWDANGNDYELRPIVAPQQEGAEAPGRMNVATYDDYFPDQQQ